MGFFSRFFKDDRQEIFTQKSIIEKIIDKYAATRDFKSILKELNEYDPDSLSEDDEENWYFFRGISEMNLGNRSIALDIFKIGLEKYPTSQRICFSIGQEYENINDKENAIKYFSQVKYNRQTADFFNRIIQYYYLWAEYELGIEMAQPILDKIYNLGIIDDTFLYIREIPFFSQIYSIKIVFSYLSSGVVDKKELQKYIDKFGVNDLEQIENLITALVDKNYQPIINSIEKNLNAQKKNKISTTFQELQIVLFKNKTENNLSLGLQRIDTIYINDNDFPWLNDVKILGKAELSARLGDNQIENEMLNKYFELQLLMFEPFISFNFGLVEYQEKIKLMCVEKKQMFEQKKV